jgi:hypothetical protein
VISPELGDVAFVEVVAVAHRFGYPDGGNQNCDILRVVDGTARRKPHIV